MHDFGARTANPSLAGQTGEVRSHRNSVAHGKFPQFVILNHAAFDFGNSLTEFFCAAGDFAASALSGAEPVETLLLLVAERAVKLLERGLHGLHRA